jgi:repressor LexA
MVQGLTNKQRTVLEAVRRYWDERGVAPSLGDLGAVLGLRRSTVHQHVLALKKKGYLEHIEGYARSWRPTGQLPMPGSRRVPVLGRVAAGLPVLAQQNIEDWITVDDAPAGSTLFALRVRGQSMIGVGILDGDLVVVRQQHTAQDEDIVVALVDGEDATVKTFHRQEGQVILEAANPEFAPIRRRGSQVRILGKVVGVRRTFGIDTE